jgi:hypothetical protein
MPKGSLIEDPRRRDNVPPENNSLMSPKVGSQLGRYKLLSPLGAGAMAEVYLAQEPSWDAQSLSNCCPIDWPSMTVTCIGSSKRRALLLSELQSVEAGRGSVATDLSGRSAVALMMIMRVQVY